MLRRRRRLRQLGSWSVQPPVVWVSRLWHRIRPNSPPIATWQYITLIGARLGVEFRCVGSLSEKLQAMGRRTWCVPPSARFRCVGSLSTKPGARLRAGLVSGKPRATPAAVQAPRWHRNPPDLACSPSQAASGVAQFWRLCFACKQDPYPLLGVSGKQAPTTSDGARPAYESGGRGQGRHRGMIFVRTHGEPGRSMLGS